MEIPDFIIHYSRGEPFRSISGVAEGDRSNVLQELNETNAWGLARFSDPEYLQRRLLVERKLRSDFVAKGGNPILDHPIYFFLGRNAHFERHERNKGYVIRLADLPKDSVSFTYGDSMFSFNEDYRRLQGEGYQSELCSRLYTFGELPGLFSHADFTGSSRLHVEAQVWVSPTSAMLTLDTHGI